MNDSLGKGERMTWHSGTLRAWQSAWLTSSLLVALVVSGCGSDKKPKTITVTDPAADQVLTTADDTDDTMEGLQYDVMVTSSGLVEGTPLRLLVDEEQVAESEVGAESMTTFAGVTLPAGQHTVVAQTMFAEISSDPEQQYTFRMLNITSPLTGTLAQDSDSATSGVQVAVTVEAFAIDQDVSLRVDGKVLSTKSPIVDNEATFVATLTEGSHTLSASANGVTSNEVMVFVERVCGNVTLVSPKPASNGMLTLGGADGTCPAAGDPYAAQFEVATDVGDGLSARLYVNGMVAATTTTSGALAVFDDVNIDTRKTATTLKVEIDSPDGVCSQTFDAQVFVDCAGPSCEITSPTPTVVTEGSTTTEYLTTQQGDGTFGIGVTTSAEMDGRNVELIIDGDALNPEQSKAATTNNTTAADFSVMLADGSHHIRARCEDAAGNVTMSGDKAWTVDITPCEVAITSPQSGATFLLSDDEDSAATGTQTLVSANVMGSDCVDARAAVCDPTSGIASGTFAAFATGTPFTVTLDDSLFDQSLCVEVRDRAGNSAMDSVDVQFFSTVPVLEILSPSNGTVYNTTGNDTNTETFEADEDGNTTGCQASFRVQCSEIGVPVELVRTPSIVGPTETILGTADCNAPGAGDTDIASGNGVAVFSSISFQDSTDPNATFTARQTYTGDTGTQVGESPAIMLDGQCEALVLKFQSFKFNGTVSSPEVSSTCPIRLPVGGVRIGARVTTQPGVQSTGDLTFTDAANAVTTDSISSPTGVFGFLDLGTYANNIDPGTTEGLTTLVVDVTDTYNNMSSVSCDYLVSNSTLDVTAAVSNPPGTTTFTPATTGNSCPKAATGQFQVPLDIAVDADSVTNASDRTLTYSVNGGGAQSLSILASQTVCIPVPEGDSSILVRLDNTTIVDFDTVSIDVSVDTLTITGPAQNAIVSAPTGGCQAGEVLVEATADDIYPQGTAVTITSGSGSYQTTIGASGAISRCTPLADGAQTITVTISGGASDSVDVTYLPDPSSEVLLSFNVQLPPNSTYRQDPLGITWTLPSGGYTFNTYEMRCSLDVLNSSDQGTKDAWWSAADEEIYAGSANSRFDASGENATSGTFDFAIGGPSLNCVLRLCDAAAQCTQIPDSSTPVNKPFRYVHVDGPSATHDLGENIEAVGDVNGDGRNDILVSAAVDTSTAATTGAYLFFGRNGLSDGDTAAPDVAITAAGETYPLGTAIAGLGDFNDDGRPDFVVTYPAYNGYSGRAYVFFGRASTNPWPSSISISGSTCPANLCVDGNGFVILGYSAAGIGDFDGDSINDMALGGYDSAGGVYIVRGKDFTSISSGQINASGATNVTGFFIDGGGSFGTRLVPAGDVNADLKADLVANDPSGSTLTFVVGRAHSGSGVDVISGGDLNLIASGSANSFATRIQIVANVFDPPSGPLTTVGMQDLAVFTSNTDQVLIFPGDSALASGFDSAAASILSIGGLSGSRFGRRVAVGISPAFENATNPIPDMDLDQDGMPDFCVGSELGDGVNPPGRGYCVTGDAITRKLVTVPPGGGADNLVTNAHLVGGDITPPSTSSATATNTRVRNVQQVGDITGDGYSDLAIGDVPVTGDGTDTEGGFWILF